MNGQVGIDHFKKCYDQFLDSVGDMDSADVNAFEDKMLNWILCDGVDPLVRSGYLSDVDPLTLSIALTKSIKAKKEK